MAINKKILVKNQNGAAAEYSTADNEAESVEKAFINDPDVPPEYKAHVIDRELDLKFEKEQNSQKNRERTIKIFGITILLGGGAFAYANLDHQTGGKITKFITDTAKKAAAQLPKLLKK